MDWQANPYTAPAGIAAGLAAGLAVLALRRRSGPGAVEFAVFALAVAVWCFGTAASFARADLDGKLLWTRIEYAGVVAAPVAWLACAAAYTRQGVRLARGQLAALSIIPLATLLLVWTNESHQLFWTEINIVSHGSIRLWSAAHGPWFSVHVAYSYLMLAAASWLIIRLLRESRSQVRRQTMLILVGMAAPWFANILYLSGASPVPDVDLTPFGFFVGAVAVGGAFFASGLFDVVPIAREALLRSLPDGVIVLDSTSRILEMNAAAERLLGRSDGSILEAALRAPSAGPSELSPEPFGGSENVSTHVLTDEGGGARSFDVRRAPLGDPGGRQVGWLVVVEDVTPRIQSEAARVQVATEQAARAAAETAAVERAASEERLRLALEAGGMGAWDWNVRADVCSGSTESRTFFGFEDQPHDVATATVLARIHPDDRRRLLRQIASTFKRRGDDLSVELRLVAPGRPLRWVAVRGRVLRETGGSPKRVVGVLADITERKLAEERREAFARAEQLRVLGQMAGGIAHDLNQSLALVSGHAELARQELAQVPPDVPLIAEQLEVIVHAAQDGAQSINRLMAFARSRRVGRSEVLDVGAVLREVAQLTGPRWRDASQAEGRPIRLTVQAEAGISVSADWGLLREALTNLVFNAVDALPHGGSIQLEASSVAERACIIVRDSGIGMSAEVRARAFEPFYTTKGERGTGLGLAQVSAAIHELNGEVVLESAQGHGTCVRILLPLSLTSVQSVSPPAGEDVVNARRSLRILVVDDEERLARMMAQVLSSAGHEVATSFSAEAALDFLATNSRDLVITDLGLGAAMNGWELTAEVRRRHPETRVVLATGWGADIDSAEARQRGVEAVLPKPYRMHQVRQIVAEIARSLATS